MKRIVLSLFLCSFSVLFFKSIAAGQGTATGFPPYGSFENGEFDSVNRSNLNVHFAIPIASYPGRGMNFSFSLVNDSMVWYPNGSWTPVAPPSHPRRGTISACCVLYGGWSALDAVAGSTGYIDEINSVPCPNGTGNSYPSDNYSYADTSGTLHTFNVTTYYPCANPGGTGFATDNSGYYLDATRNAIFSPLWNKN